MLKSLSPKPFASFFSYQLPKIYLHFQNEIFLMKSDTFDFKSLPAFLLRLYPLRHLIISSHLLLYSITRKTVSEEVREDEIKLNEMSHI